jgi:hypothetical protein
MATVLNTNNYSKLNNDIIDIMRSGLYSGVSVNIYTDADATIFAVDGNTPIEGKKINNINTTGAYTIAANNQYVNGSIELIFNDGTSFKVVDNVDECWYTIEGIIFQRRTF